MTYQEAIAYIHGMYGVGEKRGLENMHALMARLGNPERSFRAIHVAGTNGKGSVCAFLQAGLRCAGYRTGLYTSPFLQRYNERMRIDGVPIADQQLARLMTRLRSAVEALHQEGVFPTEFELGTALAFTYFAEEAVDIAVVEVGLGGRLDPTNILTPCISVIAAIGLDHMRALGDTIEAIAAEKAGIIKPHVPLVVSSQNDETVMAVIVAHAEKERAPVYIAEPTDGIALGIPGEHQAYNAAAAYCALTLLKGRGFAALSNQRIEEGLRRARWPGRLEWIAGEPPVLLDGAHNEQGVAALMRYVGSLPPGRNALVCGIMQDKAWQPMVALLASFAQVTVTVAPENQRALPAETLAEGFTAQGVAARAASSVAAAIALAREEVGADGRVIIAGSLYLVGEARSVLGAPEATLLASD